MWGTIKRQNLWSLGTDEDKESHDCAWTRSSTKSYKKTSPRGKNNWKPQLSLHYQPVPPDLTLASWSVDQRPACGPTTWPSAGLGGVSGIFMYPLHTHEPMQVLTLALQVSVPFAHSPLTLRLLGALPLTVGRAWKASCLK